MPSGIVTLIIVTGSMLALFVIITTVGNNYSLNQIKNKTVGQGRTELLVGRPKRKSRELTSKLIFSLTSGEIILKADQLNKE